MPWQSVKQLRPAAPPAHGGAVLVTGASSGIGEATALRLASHGWRVIAGVRKDADAQRLCTLSSRIEPIFLDLNDDETIDKAAVRIEEMCPDGLAGLVNNAGLATVGPVEGLDREDWNNIIGVNLIGTALVTRAMLPALLHGKGRIITIGSGQGRVAFPLFAPYAASKFGVVALTDSLRRELIGLPVSVTLIEPGVIATKAFDSALPGARAKVSDLPSDVQGRYSALLSSAFDAADGSAEGNAASPDIVARKVLEVLTTKRLRKRYAVGNDGQLVAALGRFTPSSFQDLVVTSITR